MNVLLGTRVGAGVALARFARASASAAASGIRRAVGRLEPDPGPGDDDGAIRIAPVFDGCEAGTPWFAVERRCIADLDERRRLLMLLGGGEVVYRAEERLTDQVSGEPGTVRADLRSDGSWIWSEAVAHYLERHRIRPDRSLIDHLSTTHPVARLDAVTRVRVRAALSTPEQEVIHWSRI